MAPRQFDSEIIIDSSDRWIFRGNEITQPEILKYFRSNLKQDEKGLYIENIFGELREHGYVQSIGYPCHVISIEYQGEELYLYTDDGREYLFPDLEIYQTKDNRIIGVPSETPLLKYRFDWNAASSLAELLEEDNGVTYLCLRQLKMELPFYEGELGVSLPAKYD